VTAVSEFLWALSIAGWGAAAVWWHFHRACPHIHVRCTHGDEILARRWRRRVCLDCGRSLDGPMPPRCWYSGALHFPEELPEFDHEDIRTSLAPHPQEEP